MIYQTLSIIVRNGKSYLVVFQEKFHPALGILNDRDASSQGFKKFIGGRCVQDGRICQWHHRNQGMLDQPNQSCFWN